MLQKRLPVVAAVVSATALAAIYHFHPGAAPQTIAEPRVAEAPSVPPGAAKASPAPETVTDGSLTLTSDLSHEVVSRAGETTMWVRVGVDAASVESDERPPIDLALVIDRSGSMRGEKMEMARRAAHELLARMGEDDRLSVVTFGSEARIEHRLAPTASHKHSLTNTLEQLSAFGSTNISGGYNAGLQTLADVERRSTRAMFLLSDGHANVGERTPRGLGQLAARGLRREEVPVTTLGIGDSFDEQTLGTMAVQGGGKFHYVESAEKLREQLEAEWEGFVSATARRVQLQLTPTPGVTVREVYGFGHESADRSTRVRLDTLFPGHPRHVIVELGVWGEELAGRDLLEVALSYEDVSRKPTQRVRSVTNVSADTVDRPLTVDDERPEVTSRVRRVLTAHAVDRADRLWTGGETDRADELLRETKRDNLVFLATHGPSDDVERANRQVDRARHDLTQPVQEKRQIRIRKKRKQAAIEIIRGKPE